jgi:hypothetical protein
MEISFIQMKEDDMMKGHILFRIISILCYLILNLSYVFSTWGCLIVLSTFIFLISAEEVRSTSQFDEIIQIKKLGWSPQNKMISLPRFGEISARPHGNERRMCLQQHPDVGPNKVFTILGNSIQFKFLRHSCIS